jgi:hypothetical protein
MYQEAQTCYVPKMRSCFQRRKATQITIRHDTTDLNHGCSLLHRVCRTFLWFELSKFLNLTLSLKLLGSRLRDISKILELRNDLSPFLVHLTRDTEKGSAHDNLTAILKTRTLQYGEEPFSDARFGFSVDKVASKRFYFSAISFTETPLSEVHNLLEISGRSKQLQPYGLVFLKDNLKEKGVSPVFYINNLAGDKDGLVEVLCGLIRRHRVEAAQILPYIAVFGRKLNPKGGTPRGGKIDFTWEREWRYTSKDENFRFDKTDVFVGLCPHDEIQTFEKTIRWLKFIDPVRNMKWYAEKLLSRRRRLGRKFSVA